MKRLLLTRASQLIEIAKTLEQQGGSAQRVLSERGWPDWYLAQPEALIPTHHIGRFFELAARAAGNSTLGHLVGETDPVGALGGGLGRRILAAATVHDALCISCDQLRVHTSNVRAWLAEGGADHLWLCFKPTIDDFGGFEMEQCNLMQAVRIVRLGAGPDWRPRLVLLRAGRLPVLEKTPLLEGVEIRDRRPVTAIAIPREVLARPLRSGQRAPTVPPADAVPPSDDLVGASRRLIESWLPYGAPTIEIVAEAAGLQVRTLQRHLARAGVSHAELVERARFEAARRLLADPDVRITEIAFEVGYGHPSNFTAAFRRWAGLSPRQYRRQALAH